MDRALKLARKAEGRTSPNPLVGAVLVRDGAIVAEDYHRKPGTPHAEALVIAKAGERARDADLYVTLEPCCHTEKRTPPCTRSIISAGVRKVVAAMADPNPRVSGRGFDELRRHRIEVVSGVLEDGARRLNEAYIKFITEKLPFVTLKIAMTLDGKIATPEGESKWITGEKARAFVHRMRGRSDALLSAIGTVRADNPSFTARVGAGRHPLRIIIDPLLETPLEYKVLQTPPGTVVVTRKAGESRSARDRKRAVLSERGVRFIEYDSDRVDLQWLMGRLGEMGITSVMIEGGASLNASALRSGIVDKVAVFIAPKMIGGRASIPCVGGESWRRLDEAYRFRDVTVKKLGGDILIEAYVDQNNPARG